MYFCAALFFCLWVIIGFCIPILYFDAIMLQISKNLMIMMRRKVNTQSFGMSLENRLNLVLLRMQPTEIAWPNFSDLRGIFVFVYLLVYISLKVL